jgi:TP901 family phage tail tape measure protein
MSTLGTIKGQVIIDTRAAIAAYTALRTAHAATILALNRSSLAFAAAGTVAGAGAVALAAGLGVAIKKAADFEKQLDFFGAVSASTQAEMAAISEKALQLGQDTIYSAGQIADSFVELGKAGVPAKLIIDGVGDAVAHLGAAADIPLDRAAQIMTAAVQTFSLAGSEAVHVADLLAGAANASIVEVEDLGVSLKYAGGVAAALKIPVGDVVNALALLGKYGIKGSTAGTSLRQILVSLTGTSKKATKQLEELGIITADGSNKFFDSQGNAKSLAEVFQILQDATAGLSNEQKLAAFKTIFNNRALAAALDLTKAGADGFAKMNEELSKTTAAEVSAKRLDNLSGDVEILRGNIDTLLIKAGTPFQDFLRGIVQNVTKVVQAFANLSPETQTLIFKILAFAAAGLAVIAGLAGFIRMLFSIGQGIMALVSAFKLLWAGLQIAMVAFRALGIAMVTNPVGLIILGIIALIAAIIWLWNNCEWFRNAVVAVWEAIKTGFSAVVEWFKGLPAWFNNLWNSIKTGAENIWNNIVSFFTVTIPGFFQNAWNTITSGVTSFVDSFLTFWRELPEKVKSWVSQLVNGVIDWFAQLPYRVGYALGFLLGVAVGWIINLHNAIVTKVSEIYQAVVNWFQLLPGRVAEFFSILWANAVNWFTQTRDSVIQKALEIYNGVVDWVQKLPGRVSEFFSQLWNNIVNWLTRTVNTAKEKAIAIYTAIVNWVQGLPGRIGEFFSEMYNKARNALSNLWTAAKDFGANIYNGLVEWVRKIPGAVQDAVGNAIQAFKDMVGRAFNAARDFASGLWEGFKNGLGINSPSFIEKQMVQITRVVGEETGQLRGQVRKVQYLGSKLTSIPTMSPNDQSLVGGYAASWVAQLTTEADKLKALQAQADSLSFTPIGPSMTAPATFDPTALAQALASAGVGSSASYDTEITVNSPPGMSPDQLAQAIARRWSYSVSSGSIPSPAPVMG